jgi:hypothetical protein
MDVFIFGGDLFCEECGAKTQEEMTDNGEAPADPSNEDTYDSDDYPKGPFPDGGGEADSPQHCGDCGVFLENALTSEGLAYVQEAVEAHDADRLGLKGNSAIIAEWRQFYEIKAKHEENDDGEA